MLDSFIYKNHLGEEIEFGKSGIFVNESDLRDFTWNIVQKNGKIYSFAKEVTERKLPVVIACNSEAEGFATRNRIYELCEKDVVAQKYGHIIIGEYYLRCYVTASAKTNYLVNKKVMNVTLTITTDYPYWVKDTTYRFGYGSNAGVDEENTYFDFPYDFPHDYTFSLLNTSVRNTGIISTQFKIVIYGACENPSVVIGDHPYTVFVTLNGNETLTIDSSTKKIYKTDEYGIETNCFNSRDREHYIFEKIKSGSNLVDLVNCYRVDVTVYDERSEPKWI